ncbi:MAG TPA: hypothetical protein ACFYEK_12600 [Candidatus Wunengus sp. YC60]|uniref:hypothetical protein n=1 Tax=Candidatus Wunengus sp. YC60 TaxID=3367697 RepID=UPI004026AC32
MEIILNVKCTKCGRKYYVFVADSDLFIPKDAKPGEALAYGCPNCEGGNRETIVDEN